MDPLDVFCQRMFAPVPLATLVVHWGATLPDAIPAT